MNEKPTPIICEGDLWAQVLSVYLYREGIGEIVISVADIQRITADATRPVLAIQDLIDGIHIKMVPFADAMELAEQTKGGFGKS